MALVLFVFLAMRPLPFLSLSTSEPEGLMHIAPAFSSMHLSLPPSLDDNPFRTGGANLNSLLAPFPANRKKTKGGAGLTENTVLA